MFAMEDYTSGKANPSNNPNYHSKNDKVSTLNLKLHAEITRGLLATVATLSN